MMFTLVFAVDDERNNDDKRDDDYSAEPQRGFYYEHNKVILLSLILRVPLSHIILTSYDDVDTYGRRVTLKTND